MVSGNPEGLPFFLKSTGFTDFGKLAESGKAQ